MERKARGSGSVGWLGSTKGGWGAPPEEEDKGEKAEQF